MFLADIGIIGGADGPTAVFVTGRFPWEILILAVFAVIAAVQIRKRRK